MTEKKQYELAYENDDWWAVRNGYITLWKEEVIDELNNQSIMIESQTKQLQKQYKIIEEQDKRIQKLERENKCLKESMKLTHSKKLENMSNEEFWNIIKNMRGES